MSPLDEHGGAFRARTDVLRAFASCSLCALMLLSSISLFSDDAVSDPVVLDNPDDTNTVVWDFDDPDGYVMDGVELSDGDARLTRLNDIYGDHGAEDYAEGDLTNLDMTALPGSLIIDEGGLWGTYDSQPGPEGVDAHISENRPDDNYGSSTNMFIDSEDSKSFRILMRFDVSAIPSVATVSNATLWIYELSGSRGDDVIVDVYRLSRPFAEYEVTWLQSAYTVPWENPGGDYDSHSYGQTALPTEIGWVGIDLTELVQAWAEGSFENFGLILVPVIVSDDNQKVFQTSDDLDPVVQNPRLIVNYSIKGDAGLFVSRVMGPGTNATFTQASFDTSTLSHLDDGFSGEGTFAEWSWTNEPLYYDVNETVDGWLHVVGEPDTSIWDTTVTCNFMHQNVTGAFSATTYLEDEFSETSMGAGLLLYESDSDWMYIAKTQHTATSRIQVVLCQDGTSTLTSDIVWSEASSAHLMAERDADSIRFLASVDGITYQLVYEQNSSTVLADNLYIGLFVYSGSASSPVVGFDHFTVAPLEVPTIDLRVRFGNSTTLSDQSWENWDSVEPISSPAILDETGRLLQYRVAMSSSEDWCTPVFSGFDCWCEMYSTYGTITTMEYVATDFSKWIGMTTEETDAGGIVTYRYSTDGGSTWVTAGSGGSYSIVTDVPSFMVRAELRTYDTVVSPQVHSVSATHVTAVSYLVVDAPTEVIAGATFPVTITLKDGADYTMVHWSGDMTLSAMEVDCVTPAETELEVTSAWITSPGTGSVTVLNEAYTVAGTIVIKVVADEGYGFSDPITVSPGPVSSLYITPTVGTLLEGAQQMFTSVASDDYGNAPVDIEYSWTVDAAIGTLNASGGSSVIFTAGEAGNSGYIRVSTGGLTASLYITVTHTANAPMFIDDVPDQVEYEDFGSWTIDIGQYVYDAVHDDYDLRWYITGEEIVDVTGENRTGNLVITFSTKLNIAGTDELTLYVVDPDGLWSATEFTVEIIPVNDWPTISLIDPLVVRYDVLYIYNMRYYIQDADNTEDELSMWVDDESAAYVTVEGLKLQMIYPAEFVDTTQTVIVTVSDGYANASTVIRVTVSSNNVPVLSDSIPSVDMYQGESRLDEFDLDDYFTDPDGDDLTFSYWYSHVLVNISAEHMVSFFAPTDWYGIEYVIFSATDEYGARVESAATVVVHRVNQPPSIEGVPDLMVKHDLAYRFDLTWYLSDPDNDVDDLHITTGDSYAVPSGLVLTLEYPESFIGTPVLLTITVSDGELSDSCTITVTVGNNTPPTVGTLPMHSFQEDLPRSYPSSGELDGYFDDADGEVLTYLAFSLTEGVYASAEDDGMGEWSVEFTTLPNWNGYAWFVVRGADPDGAIVETVVELTVMSVPDAPVLAFTEPITVQTGVQRAVDLYSWASDADGLDQGLSFSVASAYAEYAQVIEGVLVLEFPQGFLDEGEEQRSVGISISASDPDGLHATDILSVIVVGTPEQGGSDQWLLIGMLAMAGVASGSFLIAMRLRKRPFVIKDIMVIHNDGFLIGRAAAKVEDEIDEDILSGMLTAVLNFVEDSMAKTQDGLKSFGFEHYKVLVKRGKMTYMAVVYEGDAPEAIDDRLSEFLAKVEKIYRKRIESWTGDMDTDFAGIEVLLRAFVKENSRKGNGINGAQAHPDEKEPSTDDSQTAK